MEMYALAAKGRDTREVGQAYRGTSGKYAKHTEGLKAFIMRRVEKKGRRPAAPLEICMHTEKITFPGVMQYPYSTREEV